MTSTHPPPHAMVHNTLNSNRIVPAVRPHHVPSHAVNWDASFVRPPRRHVLDAGEGWTIPIGSPRSSSGARAPHLPKRPGRLIL